MTLQIHHAPESGTMTIRWRLYAPERNVLIGFVDSTNKFTTSHPLFDDLHGARWGENVKAQITQKMKGAK